MTEEYVALCLERVKGRKYPVQKIRRFSSKTAIRKHHKKGGVSVHKIFTRAEFGAGQHRAYKILKNIK